jgi:hypothetical protein
VTIERKRSKQLSRSKIDPTVRNKYRIAQEFLKIHPLDTERFYTPPEFRYTYIALVQSIAGAQELGIPHSPLTQKTLDTFLELSLWDVRFEMIRHSNIDELRENLWETITVLTDQSIDASEEIALYEKIYALSEEEVHRILADKWDDFLRVFGPEEFREIVKMNIWTDQHKKWIPISKDIHTYLHHKKGNPVILFERLRDLAHVHGMFLEDRLDIRGSAYGYPFFTHKELEELTGDEWQHPYHIFMDLLSENAFQFDIPYRFGYDGKKEEQA